MSLRKLLSFIVVVLCSFSLAALSGCGGGGDGDDAGGQPDAIDDAGPEDPGAGVDIDDTGPGIDTSNEDAGPATAKCLDEMDAGATFTVQGLNGPVEVVRDQWGIPHIYASDRDDMFYAQGFIQAMDRSVQMQGMRLITHGDYHKTALISAGDISNDVYMRVLDFKGVAEEMWADIQAHKPDLAAMLESYSYGVTAFFEAATADKSLQSLEWAILAPFEPWTPVDVLMIGRLQVWDLSFDGQTEELTMMEIYEGIAAQFEGTDLEGLAADAYRSAPAADAFILGPPERTGPRVTRPGVPMDLLKRFPKGYFKGLSERLSQVAIKPAVSLGAGSNNWTVSGNLTESGHAMLSGDPHLSLRNPSVWYQVHLNTARAGGDVDMVGVTFPGVPSILLGHSAHAAWMATVHYYDVTDVYVETFSESDPDAVIFEGGEVKVEVRQETFTFKAPGDGCESMINDFVKGLPYTLDASDGKCVLTVDIEVVPHHGPIIPGSKTQTPGGDDIAMTWRWTGFEPTGELEAFVGLWEAESPDDFFAALQNYGVGAQNIVYADVDGHIAYAAFANVPIRKHVAEGNGADHPPWLPMPGDGCCEWTGYVPKAELPQAKDPESGFVATANNDATGYTQDNDPLNDPNYFTFSQDLGFREARIFDVLGGLFDAGKVGVSDMQTLQADHNSPMGTAMTQAVLDAIVEGQEAVDGEPGSDADLAQFMNDEVKAAGQRLANWDLMASSGVGEDQTEDQKDSSVATSIFNVWLAFLNQNIFDNKGLGALEDQNRAKMLLAMVAYPQELVTYSDDLGDSIAWDDVTTGDQFETREYIILKSLAQAVEFLADPDKVGPGEHGGFGVDDMDLWHWGELHSVVLAHALGGEANIPPASEYKYGYPRHGDNYCVDASNPGMKDFRFTYHHGPSMRAVYVLDPEGITMQNVIPGGQVADLTSPHYGDEMKMWWKNETHPMYHEDASVLGVAESCMLLEP